MNVEPGSFVRIPAQVVHDFRNTTAAEGGPINVFIPGDAGDRRVVCQEPPIPPRFDPHRGRPRRQQQEH
jgi:mannose-6-phosphate isomerase-like protein (cupin superfamily)